MHGDQRRGIALVIALALLTLLGLLIAGAFASSTLGERSSRLTQSDAQLAASGDYAINTVLGDPRSYGLADLPFGEARTFDVSIPNASGIRAVVSATRLRAGILWLVADVTMAGIDQGQRRVSVVARFPSLANIPPAGLVSGGNVIARESVVFVTDTSSDPDCTVLSIADVIVAPGATATVGDSTRVVVQSSAADSASYFLTSRQLAAFDSAPTVVHARGDTTIGGRFDGILIVDGSLT